LNHRELILSGQKKARFHFLQLPEELQDEIIDGLDSGKLTLEAARDLVADRGYSLSHEAIASYYRAVRRERRLVEINSEVTRLIARFAEAPAKENLEALLNMVISTALVGLADGNVRVKDIDLAKMFKVLKTSGSQPGGGEPAAADKSGGGLSDDLVAQIKREILTG